MNLLLKNLHLIEPQHPLHGEIVDILIEDGIILRIKSGIRASKETQKINCTNTCVSVGWIDVGTQIGEPGYEHREDMESVSQAALHGGFSALAVQPNTSPALHSKSEIQYVVRNSEDNPVDFYPIGAISKDCKGAELSELYDMQQAGAVAFSDGKYAIQHAGLMLRALQYVKAFDGVIMNQPNDKSIASDGQMNEGYWSTILGTKGLPSIAEDLMVERDIKLAKYADSRVHISNVSTAESVDLIRQAKKAGVQVTCSVAIANLIYEDAVLESFDENFKIFPPLRTEKDKLALQKGLQDGTIDFIATNHMPWDKEAKDLEFAYSKFGMIGLETCFALSNTYLSEVLTTEQIVDKLAYRARQIFNLPTPEIKVGAVANLTLFDTQKEWTFTKSDIQSKSQNTPFIGHVFKGKVIGMIQGKAARFFEKEVELA